MFLIRLIVMLLSRLLMWTNLLYGQMVENITVWINNFIELRILQYRFTLVNKNTVWKNYGEHYQQQEIVIRQRNQEKVLLYKVTMWRVLLHIQTASEEISLNGT